MKKKIVAITISLTLALGTAAAISAAPPTPPLPPQDTKAGLGSVEFTLGSGDISIISPIGEATPPTSPPLSDVSNENQFPPVAPPANKDYATWQVSNMNIGFGSQSISNTDQTYFSLIDAASPDERLVGIIVDNDTLVDTYSVLVNIGAFSIGPSIALDQFDLTLVRQGTNDDIIGTVSQSTATLQGANDTVTVLTVDASVSGGNSSTLGGVAGHWSGELLVKAGAVQLAGNAQAVMTWTVMGPTPGPPEPPLSPGPPFP